MIGFNSAPAMVIGFTAVLVGLQTGRAMLQDIKAGRRTKPKKQKKLPFITIVLQAQGDDPALFTAMQSVMQSTFRKFELVIIVNAPCASERIQLDKLKKRYPKRIRQIVMRPAKTPLQPATLSKRYVAQQGLTLIFDTPHSIDKDTLGCLAMLFAADDQLGTVRMRQERSANNLMSTLASRYSSLFFAGVPETSGPIIVKPTQKNTVHAAYDASVVTTQLSSGELPRATTSFATLLATMLCGLLLLAVFYRQPTYFAVGWALFTIPLSISVMTENYSRTRKIHYLKHLVIAYVLFCGQFILDTASRVISITHNRNSRA